MTIVKSKPTSPGRRCRVKISNQDLYKGQPYEPLLAKLNKTGGRNNQGRITTRHIGGGHKKRYRIIDFKRNKDNIPATVERLEYDPNSPIRLTPYFWSSSFKFTVPVFGVLIGIRSVLDGL